MLLYGQSFDRAYQLLMIITALLAIILYQREEIPEPFSRTNSWSASVSTILTWIVLVGSLLLLGYATKSSEIYSRRILLTWFVATPPAIILVRQLLERALLPLIRSKQRSRRVVIAGANEIAYALADRIANTDTTAMRLLGFFDDRNVDRLGDLPKSQLLGKLYELADFVKRENVDVIFIALPIKNVKRVTDLLDRLQDTTVSIYFLPDIFVFDLIQCRTTDIGGLPAVALCETPFYGPSGVVKRLSDIMIALTVLTIAAPLLLAIAIAVKVSSPGSMIFKQRRYGLDGRQITVYKFRTMHVSEDGSKILQATQDDPRITPLGKFLRKYSLDELPQFVNVLQGQMSVVGPRPHAVAHNEQYRTLIKGYMLRHKVRPGITGLAQIKGLRGETRTVEEMRKRIEYDLEYLRSWSLALDMRIIAKTIWMIFSDSKAY